MFKSKKKILLQVKIILQNSQKMTENVKCSLSFLSVNKILFLISKTVLKSTRHYGWLFFYGLFDDLFFLFFDQSGGKYKLYRSRQYPGDGVGDIDRLQRVDVLEHGIDPDQTEGAGADQRNDGGGGGFTESSYGA